MNPNESPEAPTVESSSSGQVDPPAVSATSSIPRGLEPSSIYSRHVFARLVNFTSDATPWPRRLWDVGTLLALEELYEAGSWHERGVLSSRALDWQQKNLPRLLGPDSAIGDKALRRELTNVLGTPLHATSDARRRLRELIDLIRPGYLQRWAHRVEQTEPPAPERVARTVASHLLDLGYSHARLQQWLHESQDPRSATELVHSAATLANTPERLHEVVTPLRSVPEPSLAKIMKHWLTKEEFTTWLIEHSFAVPPERLVGAFCYRVWARDPEAAVQTAAGQLDKAAARASFTRTAGELRLLGYAYVAGHTKPLPLTLPERGIDLVSLVMEKQIYAVGLGELRAGAPPERNALDDALEQAATLNKRALVPALTGGWVALESLLTESQVPKDPGRVIAATRAAAIVACSWPRAELTALSYRIRPGDPLAERLKECRTARHRSLVMAEWLHAGSHLPLEPGWRHDHDLAATQRMRQLVANPQRDLTDVHFYLEHAFRRLYRARNIIVHGGSTTGVALPATLRVMAPLVGAALDRIAHAYLTDRIEPLTLATRAELAIRLLDSQLNHSIASLIG